MLYDLSRHAGYNGTAFRKRLRDEGLRPDNVIFGDLCTLADDYVEANPDMITNLNWPGRVQTLASFAADQGVGIGRADFYPPGEEAVATNLHILSLLAEKAHVTGRGSIADVDELISSLYGKAATKSDVVADNDLVSATLDQDVIIHVDVAANGDVVSGTFYADRTADVGALADNNVIVVSLNAQRAVEAGRRGELN